MNPESSGSAWLAVFDLDVLRPAMDAWTASLSREERDRADRFRDPLDADRYRLRRGVLRSVLAMHLGGSPEGIRYALGPHGKPSIEPASALRFNASSSGPLFALALATNVELGVDVERVRPVGEWRAIAARLFPAGSAERLAALAGAERTEAFMRLWTAKEAADKLAGTGLTERADVGEASPGLDPNPAARPQLRPIAIRSLEVATSAIVALATEAPLRALTSPRVPEGLALALVPWVEAASTA